MPISSFSAREFRPPMKFGKKRVKQVRCLNCDSKLLARYVFTEGYIEIQCSNCGGFTVIRERLHTGNKARRLSSG